VDDLEIVRHEVSGRTHRVEFAGPGGSLYAAQVEVGRLDPRPLTCKASHPHTPRHFEVRLLESVED
jgi:hypothetical protein